MDYEYNQIDSFLNNLLAKSEGKLYEIVGFPQPDTDDTIEVGSILPIEIPYLLDEFMQWWVEEVDCKVDTVKKWSESYITLLSRRIFTLDEFRVVMSGKIKEENFEEETVFDYLQIYDRHALDLFISKMPSDEELATLYRRTVQEYLKTENTFLDELLSKKKMNLYFPIPSLDRHVHILAKSGSGKSEIIKLIFYKLQKASAEKRNKSLVAIAPEADLPTELLRFHLNEGKNMKRVVFLDPNIRETARLLIGEDVLKEDFIFHINPLQIKDKDKNNSTAVDNHTQQLSKAFFEIFREDSSLSPNMKPLVKGCISTLLRMKGVTVFDLKRFMDDDQNNDLVNAGKSHPNDLIRDEMNKFQGNSRTGMTKASLNSKLYDLLINETFANVLMGNQTVDIEDEINNGKIVIGNFTKGKFGNDGAPAFGKLLVALIQAAAMKRENTPKQYRMNTYMFLDEFQNYVNPSIRELMAESRKFGLKAILSHQIWGQDMSPALSKIITGNTSLKVGGESDKDTRKHLINQFRGVKEKDFEELKKFNFFVYDTNNKRKGTMTLQVPNYLVGIKPPLYMDKSALKKYFLWLAHESGYYVKVSENENKRTKRSGFSDDKRKEKEDFNPGFEY